MSFKALIEKPGLATSSVNLLDYYPCEKRELQLALWKLQSEHRNDFICCHCKQPAILHVGALIKTPHFQHKSGYECPYRDKESTLAESLEHQFAKLKLREMILSNPAYEGCQIDFEVVIDLPDGRWREADVAVLFDGKVCEVFEAQLSPISISDLEARTNDYYSVGLPVYWFLRSNKDEFEAAAIWCEHYTVTYGFFDYASLREESKIFFSGNRNHSSLPTCLKEA